MAVHEAGKAEPPAWRKTSFCASRECVEVAHEDGMIVLRDSKEPPRYVRYTVEEWESFIQGVKAGEFDDLGNKGAYQLTS
jgi:hypothetical protein